MRTWMGTKEKKRERERERKRNQSISTMNYISHARVEASKQDGRPHCTGVRNESTPARRCQKLLDAHGATLVHVKRTVHSAPLIDGRGRVNLAQKQGEKYKPRTEGHIQIKKPADHCEQKKERKKEKGGSVRQRCTKMMQVGRKEEE